jgi:hypothetical protein
MNNEYKQDIHGSILNARVAIKDLIHDFTLCKNKSDRAIVEAHIINIIETHFKKNA